MTTSPKRSPRARMLAASVLVLALIAALSLVSYRVGLQRGARSGLAQDVAPLQELYGRLQREAVRPPRQGALGEGALQGMISGLGDPYAEYYNADEFAQFNRLLEGEFSGVGIQLQDSPEGPLIVNVIRSTPAEQAGVTAGERIVAVDGRDVRKLPIDALAKLIAGKEGTPVTIGLEGGPAGAREVRLIRARIELPDVESRLESDGIGYISLLQFSERAGERIRSAASDLRARGARGIVLDLRGNPGGLLDEAVKVASVFVENGVVVSVRGRGDGPGEGQVYRAEGDALEALSLVVLVDHWSASASEIVAAAVQDLDRGTVLGEKTYGKGTVQVVERLGNGGGVKFTTAEYLTPGGRRIEGEGVIPDRVVTGETEQLAAARQALQQRLAAGGGPR